MPLATDSRAYEDIRPYFEKALASEKGIRVELPTKGQAVNLRQRLYTLRKLDRIASTDTFDIGDERYGVSPYDLLNIEVQDNVLLITHRAPNKVSEL